MRIDLFQLVQAVLIFPGLHIRKGRLFKGYRLLLLGRVTDALDFCLGLIETVFAFASEAARSGSVLRAVNAADH